MKNKTLIELLEQLNPDNEICIEIHELYSGRVVGSTYSIDCDISDSGTLIIKADIENEKC